MIFCWEGINFRRISPKIKFYFLKRLLGVFISLLSQCYNVTERILVHLKLLERVLNLILGKLEVYCHSYDRRVNINLKR